MQQKQLNATQYSAVLVAALLFVAAARAATINVPGDQPTIAAAIAAASSGDVINIAAGGYAEDNLTIPNGVDLTIQGSTGAPTIISGGNDDADPVFAFADSGQTAATVLRNLAINNAGGGPAVLISGNATPTLQSLHFFNCRDAAAVEVRSPALIDACTFTGANNADEVVSVGGDAKLLQCVFHGNDVPTVIAANAGTSSIVNCTIVASSSAVAADIAGAVANVSNSAIVGALASTAGTINTERCLYAGATGDNIDAEPTFLDESLGFYSLAPGTPGIDAADDDAFVAAGGGAVDVVGLARKVDLCVADTGGGAVTYLDIGAFETQSDDGGPDADGDGIPDDCDACPDSPNVYNATQDTYFPTIADAIAGAASGDVIELGACVFYERDLILDNRDVTIRGQGAAATVIDGAAVSGTILGITNFDASVIEDITFRNAAGIAVNATNVSEPVLVRCRFEGNDAGANSQGAIALSGDAKATFRACEFVGNTSTLSASTVSVTSDSTEGDFVNCLFHENAGAESAVNCKDGFLTFVNCTFAATLDGQLMQTSAGGTVVLKNCIFDTSAGFSSDVITTRCLFPGATGDDIDGAPTYVDAAGGDYSLAPGSLGIDAANYGDYVAIGGEATDAAGMPRLVDDCAVDDTGGGMIAYLDLGAFELQTSDADADGVQDECDMCIGFDDAADADVDGIPDDCDACPGSDDAADADADGVPDGCDVCLGFDDNADGDSDSVPDGCDVCLGFDDAADADTDGVPDGCDACPGSDDSADADSDGVPDACDVCPGSDDTVDTDGDGVADGCDLCAGADDSIDTDADGTPDGCDACPNNEDAVDADSDGVSDCDDLCPDTAAGVAVDGHGCPTPASGDSGAVNGNDNAAQDADPDESDNVTDDDSASSDTSDDATDESATAPTPECGCGASGGVMMPVGLIGLAGVRRRIRRSSRRAV
ncbi:MAG: right-handed parallel beta-helix repeat-containing protein [Phycisphaerales bacterium]|nr:right-handed parallel beta-helix repeat-containing protein [Phycisphaerales bacterium]MCB9855478.1 right-handed parallel beta-helix repeat-containing protein [Phycisphaerales bacterium]MCB9864255.1 right-handed parallel beta-helix repeat-containing protein [Phycisphaerales bacterium]